MRKKNVQSSYNFILQISFRLRSRRRRCRLLFTLFLILSFCTLFSNAQAAFWTAWAHELSFEDMNFGYETYDNCFFFFIRIHYIFAHIQRTIAILHTTQLISACVRPRQIFHRKFQQLCQLQLLFKTISYFCNRSFRKLKIVCILPVIHSIINVSMFQHYVVLYAGQYTIC